MQDTRMSLAARDVAALRDAIAAGESPRYLMFWRPRPDQTRRAAAQPPVLGPWVCSQWADIPIIDTDRSTRYATAEHWMMAAKARMFGDDAALAAILDNPDPRACRALGRTVQPYDDDLWGAARYEVVVQGNVLKFGQNPELRTWLLNTVPCVLVEASPSDRVWGIGCAASDSAAQDPFSWRGTNLLGFALMEARTRLATADKDVQMAAVASDAALAKGGEATMAACLGADQTLNAT